MSEPSNEAVSVKSNRYFIGREIARGGMATVFEGRHRVTRRRVAVKVVPNKPGSRIAPRLLREARVLGELRHPSIVDVTDFEETPDHLLLVTELLEGRTLDGLLAARRRLAPDHVAGVVAQLAAALAYVHDRGIVHRDVKPSNVFVVREAASNRVKLLDFGTAGHTEHRGEARLTENGTFLGTLAYTPPEQLERTEDVDPRSDQYALGMLAVEALTGELPRLPDRLKRAPDPSLLCSETGAPPDLAAAIARMLEPSADRRFASCRAAVEGLAPPGTLDVLDPIAPGVSARRHPRAPFVTPTRLLHDGGTIDGRSENISERGLMVLLASSAPGPAEGDVLRARFAMPVSGRQIDTAVVVRWVSEARERRALGLELAELHAGLAAEVSEYLRFFASEA